MIDDDPTTYTHATQLAFNVLHHRFLCVSNVIFYVFMKFFPWKNMLVRLK